MPVEEKTIDPQSTLLSDDPPDAPDGLFAALHRRAARLTANAEEVKKFSGWQTMNIVVGWLIILVMMTIWAVGGLWGTMLLGASVTVWTVWKCLHYKKLYVDFAYIANELQTRRDRQAFMQLILHLISAGIAGIREVEVLHRPETPDLVWFRFTIGEDGKPGTQAEASCRFIHHKPLPSMATRRVVDEVVVYIRNQRWSHYKVTGVTRWISPN